MFWQWYKPNQGRQVRLTATVTVVVLGVLAALEAYTLLVGFGVQVRLGVPLVTLVAIVALGTYALNWPRVAEFLIEAESELAKVSWPSRQQVLGSTGTVLVLVLLLAIFLVGMDKAVDVFLRLVLKLYR
jgi:preprotein translocase SecE subunit